jgi:hypothetical protein
VFATPKEAANESFFGDRLDHFCSFFERNRREDSDLTKAGGFTFNVDSSMVIIFFAREPRGNIYAGFYG